MKGDLQLLSEDEARESLEVPREMACYRKDAYLAQILAGIKAIQENDA